jgi:hypothetical protein
MIDLDPSTELGGRKGGFGTVVLKHRVPGAQCKEK